MHIVVMPDHVIPSCIRFIAPVNWTNKVLLPAMLGHMSSKILLPKEAPVANLTFERSIVRAPMTLFVGPVVGC